MAVITPSVSAEIITPTGSSAATLAAQAFTWTQDAATSPRHTARLVVSMPTAAQFAMLKPGAGYFLRINAWTSATSSPVVLKVTDRTRTADGLIDLQLASGEVDLQAFTPAAVDRTCWGLQGSVTSILTYVMNRVFGEGWARWSYGASVAFGEDVGAPAYRTYRDATNLAPNGGFEYGTTGWAASQSTISAVTTQKHGGTYSLQISPSTSLNTSRATTSLNLSPGTTYTLSAWVRQSAVMGSTANAQARTIKVSANVSNVVQDLVTSTPAPNVANTWSRVVMTFTMPSLADAGSVVVQLLNGTTSSASVTVWWDDLMIVEGDGLDTDGTTVASYFDGDTVDGTAGYNYDWQGTPGNSSSTRTAIVARDPDSLTWSPGQSAWDFLQPILQAAGIQLWIDGFDPGTYKANAVTPKVMYALNEFGLTVAARSALQGDNLLDVSRVDSWSAEFPDGTPMFADQVILHYTWTDSLNQAREAYDVYPATGKKPYYKELPDTPFAGIGRAQGLYNRISARANIVQATVAFTRSILVAQQIRTTADVLSGSSVGYVEAITLDPFLGLAEFRTKDTVAYTSKSWFAATGTWASQTGSWAAEA